MSDELDKFHGELEPAVLDAEIVEEPEYTRIPSTFASKAKRGELIYTDSCTPRPSKVVRTRQFSWKVTRDVTRGARVSLRGWWRWVQGVEHREDWRAHSPIKSGKGPVVDKNRRWRLGGTAASGIILFCSLRFGLVPGWIGLVVGLVSLAGVWQAGRMKDNTQGTVVDGDEELLVFPLGQAHSPDQARECIRRALLSVKIPANVLSAERRLWGWEVLVQIVGGFGNHPSDVIKKSEALEVNLDIRQNGLLIQPHSDRRARMTLRCIEKDPFAAVGQPPQYGAISRSIADRVAVGVRLDSREIGTVFQATHSIILAASGGGKSILIRLIVDALGACDDTILWDLDPSGVGQGAQKDLFDLRALSPADCQIALERAIAIAEARARLLSKLHMGDEWTPSSDYPALVIVLDEFPRLMKGTKELAISLVRVARKAGVVLIFASQSAKKDVLSESIAGEVAFKAGGPGLAAFQSRLLFGENCIAEGWNPGSFKPKRAGRVNDAGTFFFEGLIEPDEPIPAKVYFLDNAQALERAYRYLQYPRPQWDSETLESSRLTAAELHYSTAPEAAVEAQDRAVEEDLHELPGLLQQVSDYVEGGYQQVAVPSDELAEELGVSQKRLATELAKFGLKTALWDFEQDDGGPRNQRRGYKVSELKSVFVTERARSESVTVTRPVTGKKGPNAGL